MLGWPHQEYNSESNTQDTSKSTGTARAILLFLKRFVFDSQNGGFKQKGSYSKLVDTSRFTYQEMNAEISDLGTTNREGATEVKIKFHST